MGLRAWLSRSGGRESATTAPGWAIDIANPGPDDAPPELVRWVLIDALEVAEWTTSDNEDSRRAAQESIPVLLRGVGYRDNALIRARGALFVKILEVGSTPQLEIASAWLGRAIEELHTSA